MYQFGSPFFWITPKNNILCAAVYTQTTSDHDQYVICAVSSYGTSLHSITVRTLKVGYFGCPSLTRAFYGRAYFHGQRSVTHTQSIVVLIKRQIWRAACFCLVPV